MVHLMVYNKLKIPYPLCPLPLGGEGEEIIKKGALPPSLKHFPLALRERGIKGVRAHWMHSRLQGAYVITNVDRTG
jgi:hypothetical protein